MLSALRAAVTAGASTADPALPGMSRARGPALGQTGRGELVRAVGNRAARGEPSLVGLGGEVRGGGFGLARSRRRRGGVRRAVRLAGGRVGRCRSGGSAGRRPCGRRCGRRRHADGGTTTGGGPGRRRGVGAVPRRGAVAAGRPAVGRGAPTGRPAVAGANHRRGGRTVRRGWTRSASDAVGVGVLSRTAARRGATRCRTPRRPGTGRFDRNQADAISSKIGVVSPRSNALAFGSCAGQLPVRVEGRHARREQLVRRVRHAAGRRGLRNALRGLGGNPPVPPTDRYCSGGGACWSVRNCPGGGPSGRGVHGPAPPARRPGEGSEPGARVGVSVSSPGTSVKARAASRPCRPDAGRSRRDGYQVCRRSAVGRVLPVPAGRLHGATGAPAREVRPGAARSSVASDRRRRSGRIGGRVHRPARMAPRGRLRPHGGARAAVGCFGRRAGGRDGSRSRCRGRSRCGPVNGPAGLPWRRPRRPHPRRPPCPGPHGPGCRDCCFRPVALGPGCALGVGAAWPPTGPCPASGPRPAVGSPGVGTPVRSPSGGVVRGAGLMGAARTCGGLVQARGAATLRRGFGAGDVEGLVAGLGVAPSSRGGRSVPTARRRKPTARRRPAARATGQRRHRS